MVPRKVVNIASGSYAAALKAGGPSSTISVSPTLSAGSLSNSSPTIQPQQSPRQHSLSISSDLDGGSIHSGSVHSLGHSPISHQPLPPMLPLGVQQQMFQNALPMSQYQQCQSQQSPSQITTRQLRALSEPSISSTVGGGFPYQHHDGVGIFNDSNAPNRTDHSCSLVDNEVIETPFQRQQHNHIEQEQQKFMSDASFPKGSVCSPSTNLAHWNFDSRDRSDMERSSSLGGLGWMPSSLSCAQNSSRSNSSNGAELDVGLGLGLDGLRLDQKGEDHAIGLSVPSHSDWTALVDVACNNNQNDSASQSHLPAQPLRNIFGNNIGGSNENDDSLLQELRIQASEFQPSKRPQFQSDNKDGFAWISHDDNS